MRITTRQSLLTLLALVSGLFAGCSSDVSSDTGSQSDYKGGEDYFVHQDFSGLVRRDVDTGKLQYIEALNSEFAAGVIRRNQALDQAQSTSSRKELVTLEKGTRIHILSGWVVTDYAKGTHTELKAEIASGTYQGVPILLERISHEIKAPQSSGFPYLLADPAYLRPSGK